MREGGWREAGTGIRMEGDSKGGSNGGRERKQGKEGRTERGRERVGYAINKGTVRGQAGKKRTEGQVGHWAIVNT